MTAPMDEMAIADKLAQELGIHDSGYVYFHIVDLQPEYRDKYPCYKVLSLPGIVMAIQPNGDTCDPEQVFQGDYPNCVEWSVPMGCAPCG